MSTKREAIYLIDYCLNRFQRFDLENMRIIKKKIVSKNSSGFVKVQADESEDIYYLYNLISTGDYVKAETTRNVRYYTANSPVIPP